MPTQETASPSSETVPPLEPVSYTGSWSKHDPMEVYRCLDEHYRRTGISPSIRELMAMTGISSTASVKYALEALTRGGLLRRSGRYINRGYVPANVPTSDSLERLRAYVRAMQVEVNLHRNGITGSQLHRAQRVVQRTKAELQPGDLT